MSKQKNILKGLIIFYHCDYQGAIITSHFIYINKNEYEHFPGFVRLSLL